VIHDYAKRRPEVNSERIVAYGPQSGQPVWRFTWRRIAFLRGVILVSPYDSITEVQRPHPFCRCRSCSGIASTRFARHPRFEAPLAVPCRG